MKKYEKVSQSKLIPRTPVIVRIDGRAFHTFTRGFDFPEDKILKKTMKDICLSLFEEVQNCKFIYSQSDEISLLLCDYDNFNTQPYFNNNVQKICSIIASYTTMKFNKCFRNNTMTLIKDELKKYYDKFDKAHFDARCFNLNQNEVANYFIWRQQDAIRNSVHMLARSVFSHKKLLNKSGSEMKQMLAHKGIDYHKKDECFKWGFCIDKNGLNEKIPEFVEQRDFVEQWL